MKTYTGLPYAHIRGLKQKPARSPILFWEAYFGNTCIDQNNSIALLRHKYKGQPGVTYTAIR